MSCVTSDENGNGYGDKWSWEIYYPDSLRTKMFSSELFKCYCCKRILEVVVENGKNFIKSYEGSLERNLEWRIKNNKIDVVNDG